MKQVLEYEVIKSTAVLHSCNEYLKSEILKLVTKTTKMPSVQ